MNTQDLGGISVSRIVELEGPTYAPDFLLPDADKETVARHEPWLLPRFFDRASGLLIMSFHSYLVHTAHHLILVDTCIGNDKDRPLRPNWHRRRGTYLEDLARLGARPEDVDVVLCMHLHVDHVGWNTRLADGRWVPTFPRAQYLFGRREFEHWQALDKADPQPPVNHGSFRDSVLPVVEAGRATLVDTDHIIEDGLRLEPAPGHTPGQVVLNVAGPNGQAVLSGDVMHHPLQVAQPEWSSRFCTDQDLSQRTRRALLARLADTDTLLLTGHFPTPTVGRIVSVPEGFRFRC